MENNAKLIQHYWRKKKYYDNPKKDKLAIKFDKDKSHVVFLYVESLSSGYLKSIFVRVYSVKTTKFYTEIFEIKEFFPDQITMPIKAFKRTENLELVIKSIINMICSNMERKKSKMEESQYEDENFLSHDDEKMKNISYIEEEPCVLQNKSNKFTKYEKDNSGKNYVYDMDDNNDNDKSISIIEDFES
jgi:hypothetical protein